MTIDTIVLIPTTLDERIARRRAELTQQRAARKDELDLDRTLTMRQVRDYLAETVALDREIAAFNTAVEALAMLGTDGADTQWRDFATTAEATLNAELSAIRPPIRDDATRERARAIGWSIKLIDHGLGISTIGPIVSLTSTPLGELMATAGYATSGPELRGPRGFRGSLPEVEQRIKALAQQRAAAQAALDVLLMTDAERAKRDAEDAELRDAFNAMRVKNSPDSNKPGLVAYTKDGDVLDVSEMTPLQRKAFERMDAAHRR